MKNDKCNGCPFFEGNVCCFMPDVDVVGCIKELNKTIKEG